MKANYSGCALCDATWGDYHRTVEGTNFFFCCSICADAFENMVKEVKKVSGWSCVDSVEISGNYSNGRNCVAKRGVDEMRYFFRHENGVVTEFRKTAE